LNEHTSGHDPGAGHGLSRRRFLRDTAVATGGALVLGVGERTPALVAAQGTQAGATTAATAAGSYSPVALTEDELATLKAVLARLIPADELGPGAVEAEVYVYIDRALIGAYKDSLPLYHQNLAALNKAAAAQGATSFATLSADKQDALLKKLESLTGTAPTAVQGNSQGASAATNITGATAGFFPLLLEHTREGMFGDPMYGGNKSFAGWDLVGYSGIKLVWTAEEQAIGTVVPPAHLSDAKLGGYPVS